jgi:hypothetical protein
MTICFASIVLHLTPVYQSLVTFLQDYPLWSNHHLYAIVAKTLDEISLWQFL